MDKKVMVAGHLCLDITPKFPSGKEIDIREMFSPAKLTNVEDAVLSTGGAVSNTGLAMARLGVDVLLNGKVGNDGFGDIIRRLVGEDKAKTLKTVTGQNSSYTIVLAPPGVDRFYLHSPATNDTFGPEDIDYELVKDCALFHFGYPPLMKRMYENDGAELVEMYKRIKSLGVTTSLDMVMLDPNSSSGKANWPKIMESLCPYVDIFMPSVEEICLMLDRDLYEKRRTESKGQDPVLAYTPEDCVNIAKRLHSMGVKIVMIKCGIRGLYLHTDNKARILKSGNAVPDDSDSWSNREIWAGSFKVDNFGSALGAGDSAIAGFLSAFIKGFGPEETLRIANIAGWQNVQAIDALSGIKDWPSTLESLKMNMPCNPVELDCDQWQYCQKRQVYYGPNDKKEL